MANSSVAISAGSGTLIDTRTDPDGQHRQVMCVGDPAAANVAAVSSAGGLSTEPVRPATATRSTVTAATSDTALLAAGTRFGFTVYNASTAILYLALGTAAATTSDYSVRVAAGGYYEAPFGYSGAVRGIWSAANGSALVTEVTA